jgi:Ca-activated chloride channel family protein
MKTILIGLAAVFATVPALAQPGNRPSIPLSVPNRVGTFVRADWPKIDLNILVLDRDRHPQSGLDASAFQVSENGTPQTIQTVATADAPVSLCLLIDQSGSVRTIRPAVVKAAAVLVNQLPAGSEVMLVSFADSAYVDLALTPASSVNIGQSLRPESRGGTALFDGIIATESYFLTHAHQKRRALVLFSDGGENASNRSLEEVQRFLLTPSSPVLYALGFPDESAQDSSSQSARDAGRLKTLAKMGGGIALFARNGTDLLARAEEVSTMIRSQYVIAYNSTNAVRDGRLLKLEVRMAQANKRMEIHGLSGYFAPDPVSDEGVK